MKWIELEKTSGSVYDGLRLREKYLTLSNSLRHRMGDPDYATLYFDKDALAIGLKVSSAETGRKFITSSKTCLAARLPDEMPRGRYPFVKEENGLFICCHI